jgi:hypothetical protein
METRAEAMMARVSQMGGTTKRKGGVGREGQLTGEAVGAV